jgi:hypothetical protein
MGNVVITALKQRRLREFLEVIWSEKEKPRGRMPTLGRRSARLTRTENEELEARWPSVVEKDKVLLTGR